MSGKRAKLRRQVEQKHYPDGTTITTGAPMPAGYWMACGHCGRQTCTAYWPDALSMRKQHPRPLLVLPDKWRWSLVQQGKGPMPMAGFGRGDFDPGQLERDELALMPLCPGCALAVYPDIEPIVAKLDEKAEA